MQAWRKNSSVQQICSRTKRRIFGSFERFSLLPTGETPAIFLVLYTILLDVTVLEVTV
jgi:hypothetical protein